MTMTPVGISDFGLYVPDTYVSLEPLARARGVDPQKYLLGLGQQSFSMPLSDEDTVTMAAEALENLLHRTGLDLASIGRLVVATETPVDAAKSAANYLAGLFPLPRDCELFEVKHTCAAGSYALLDALRWLDSPSCDDRQAVVICSDVARYPLRSSAEPTQGAGAVAILLDRNPALLAIEPLSGTATGDSVDFWRPLHSEVAMVNSKESVDCYLQSLRDAHADLERRGGTSDFDYAVFHAPFAKMVHKAFGVFEGLSPSLNGRFEEATAISLAGVRQWGNTYTGSLYLALVSLLAHEQEAAVGKRIALFSFGSGYSAKLFSGSVTGSYHGGLILPGAELDIDTYEGLHTGTLSLARDKGYALESIDERGYRRYALK